MGQEKRVTDVCRYEKPFIEVFEANDLLETLGTAVCLSIVVEPDD